MNNTLKQMINKGTFLFTLVIIALLSDIKNTFAQAESPKEDDFFRS